MDNCRIINLTLNIMNKQQYILQQTQFSNRYSSFHHIHTQVISS